MFVVRACVRVYSINVNIKATIAFSERSKTGGGGGGEQNGNFKSVRLRYRLSTDLTVINTHSRTGIRESARVCMYVYGKGLSLRGLLTIQGNQP